MGGLLPVNGCQWVRKLGIETEPESSRRGFFVRCSFELPLLESRAVRSNERT